MTGTGTGARPVATGERIAAIDIIRGFALFGVLWMNLDENRGLNMPIDALDHLWTSGLDRWVGFIAHWIMHGKAQTLFSLLFGFGFANIVDRLDARDLPTARIFLRRMAILFVFGAINTFLLYIGDILNAYALMGCLLYLTRRWPVRRLLLVGLPLSILADGALELTTQVFWNGEHYWIPGFDEGAEIRQGLFVSAHYPAYVAELWRSFWIEWFATPEWFVYLGHIMGRFLIGSWIFHQGWFSDTVSHRTVFVHTARIALPTGLLLAGIAAASSDFDLGPTGLADATFPLGMLLLACGYGAAIVLLHQSGRCDRLFAGLAAVGRMALTNYLMQSVFYLFAIYGFGLGLMPWLGATLSLVLAVAFFVLQMVFSQWWLARYRFGPLEWLWRSLTYGERQTMAIPGRTSPEQV